MAWYEIVDAELSEDETSIRAQPGVELPGADRLLYVGDAFRQG